MAALCCCFAPPAGDSDEEEAEAAPLLDARTSRVGVGTERGMRLSIAELKALQALFDDAGGPGWFERGGWEDPRTPPDMWYGVTVSNGHVTGLDLGSNNLSGAFPQSIAQLVFLEYLDVQENALEGPLPDFSTLQRLRWLYLNGNGFTGPVPFSLGQLGALQYLHLQDCELEGPLPRSFAQLRGLRVLQVGGEQRAALPPQVLGGGAQAIVAHVGLASASASAAASASAFPSASPNPWETPGAPDAGGESEEDIVL